MEIPLQLLITILLINDIQTYEILAGMQYSRE